ncbi:unnamed protein product, partial [Rotaria socialis]
MALYGPLLYAWLPLLVFFLQAFHGGSAHSSCSQNNGGCDQNALCSDDPTTGTTKCTCKTGYTNTGCDDNVVCAVALSTMETVIQTPIACMMLPQMQCNAFVIPATPTQVAAPTLSAK